MGSVSIEDFHAKKKKVMVKLVKGKEIAVQLQTLLHKPVEDHGPISLEALALQIFRSFSDSLSEFTSCTKSAQIAAVDCGGSASSGDSKKKLAVKERRGCYKRRRSSDSWEKVSPTMEDGCAWRKYGQKNILNSEFPRCYFRCTHKHEGCKATKQVQRIKGEATLYQTTYFNHHTCTETLRAPHELFVESDPVERNLISFQTSIQSEQDQDSSNPIIVSNSVKQEDNQSEDVSTLEDSWPDIIGLEPWAYKPEWAPSSFHSCETSSLGGLDMEVNQLSDIEILHYFDEIY